MAYRPLGLGAFALGVAVRAVIIGVLGFAISYLLATTRLYASAALLFLLLLFVVRDIARVVTRADGKLAELLRTLTEGARDHSNRPPSGFVAFGDVLASTQATILNERAETRRAADHLQALLDTVAATLLTVTPDGAVRPANQSARKVIGEGAADLMRVAALGPIAAETLKSMPVGGREIVCLANGDIMLASVAQFDSSTQRRVRLISLQSVTKDLDVVEVKAWQDLTRILAHEMMNSLTPIASLAQSLRQLTQRAASTMDSKTAEEIADATDVIERRSTGLMTFVGRYRKIADLPRPILEWVSAGNLVNEVAALMRVETQQSGLTFDILVVPWDIRICGDSTLLEHALINILRNAVDAVANVDDPMIEIRCEWKGDVVSIVIGDNGPGVDLADRNRLFLPFYTTKKSGSGIGLTLAQQVALAHGGRLIVGASPRGGAEFTLTIPVPKNAAEG